jgi:hypothetical protein
MARFILAAKSVPREVDDEIASRCAKNGPRREIPSKVAEAHRRLVLVIGSSLGVDDDTR